MNTTTLAVYCPRCGGPATLTIVATAVRIDPGALLVELIGDNPEHTCPDPTTDNKRRP